MITAQVDEKWPNLQHIGVPQPRLSVSGNPDLPETQMLARLAVMIRAKNIFEIGTYNGSTADLLGSLPSTERVWTLDLPRLVLPKLPLDSDDWRWMDAPKIAFSTDKVTQLWGDSATFDFSFYHGKCNLVYVQGAHSIEYIHSDLAAAFNLVMQNGLIVLHAGTPKPMRMVADEYDLIAINDRMAIVEKASDSSRGRVSRRTKSRNLETLPLDDNGANS